MRARAGSLLVVDDSEMNRDLLSRRLERRGYRTTIAENGIEALDAIACGGVDLVLLDIEMPGMSGLEVLTRIRETYSRLQLPIIMVTGRSDSQDIVEALSLGANDYVVKPVDLPVAVARIQTHLSLKFTEEALHRSEERYALAARGANDGLWDWDLAADEIYFSERWKSMLGYQEHEVGNRPEEWFDRVHPDDLGPLRSRIQEHLRGESHHLESEHRVMHRDGTYRWMVTRGLAVKDENGQCGRMAGSQRDVTDERVLDPLTGLPNRLLFLDRLGCMFERAKRRKDYLFAVLVLDVDRFKVINDSLGHAIGDKLLKALASRLESSLRAGDTLIRSDVRPALSRIGADEFSILLDDIKNPANASRVAARIQNEVACPFHLDGHEIFASACIGIALNQPPRQKAEDIMHDAATAVSRAKAAGVGRHELFDPSMRQQALTRLQLESDLHRALEREELKNYYQPLVETKTGRLIGFETLIRWNHPVRGLVSPAEFISVAEETGMILDIDELSLRVSCCQLRQWIERFRPAPPWIIGVNLSAKQFSRAALLACVERILKGSGLDPACLKLEVTEGLIMQNMEFAKSMLGELKGLGVKIAIDDFGTGYSSLGYLQHFPADTLKIDRSFVSCMGPKGEDAQIVAAIITLAHNLGLDVIAEGVETPGQLRKLTELGCEYAQGYYYGKATEPRVTEELLTQCSQDPECPFILKPCTGSADGGKEDIQHHAGIEEPVLHAD